MNDLYSRIVSQRGSLERLGARLPGFGGYMDMSARRQADRIIREQVAAELTQQINRLPAIEKQLLDAGGLQHMSETRSAKIKMQTFIDRVATAAPGYSGFYDAIKVTAEDLAVVYAFDEALLRYGDAFQEKLDALGQAASSGEGIKEAIAELDRVTIEANDAFSLREKTLSGLE
ncbi:hypothetical protein [Aggregatilinea lenta]|uniref:hypothetical protein n=1 Tax=Aggregatilinea lenta TaxID=913108 RepID=UPI000E5B39FE|nr:hypothetical protein [Aggregatilinea lenta]